MYCDQCGVELEPDVVLCPLCGSRQLSEAEPARSAYHQEQPPLPASVARTAAGRAVSALSLTAALILMIIDFVRNAELTWAPVPVVSVVGGAAVLLALVRRGFSVVGISAALATLLAMLAAIDTVANGQLDWFVPVALPIVTSVGLLLTVLVRVVPRVRGMLKVAVLLAGGGILTALIDLVIQGYLGTVAGLSWSVVVLISTLPTAVLCVILDRTVLRYVDLYRRFHI